MKKANTAKRKARRERALARFSIKPAPVTDDGSYAKYLERKEVELAALRASV